MPVQPWRRLEWTLPDWIEHAWKLERTLRCSRQHYDACNRHVLRFPGQLVAVELDKAILLSLRQLILDGHPNRFGRPGRGFRAEDWTTRALMDVNNQLARLDRIERRNTL